jgi:hypothetical protein
MTPRAIAPRTNARNSERIADLHKGPVLGLKRLRNLQTRIPSKHRAVRQDPLAFDSSPASVLQRARGRPEDLRRSGMFVRGAAKVQDDKLARLANGLPLSWIHDPQR